MEVGNLSGKEHHTMKVFVIGAHGQIGQKLVHLLQQSDRYTVRAMVRRESQAESSRQSGVEAGVADLEGRTEGIASAANGCDAIGLTARSPGHNRREKKLPRGRDGADQRRGAATHVGV